MKKNVPYTIRISDEMHLGIARLTEEQAQRMRRDIRMIMARAVHDSEFNPADYGLNENDKD